MYKAALTHGKADPVAQLTSDTIGRLMNLGPVPLILGGMAPFRTPDRAKHKETYEAIEKGEPEALSTTKLRLGAPNLIDDMLYAEDPEGKLPFRHRIGGRILQNPRSGIISKLLGYPTYPLYYGITSLTRSPHYYDVTDVAHNPWDMPEVTGHELGHAIDFNTVATPTGKVSDGFVTKQVDGLQRDLYKLLYNVPFLNLLHEAKANSKSDLALRKGLDKSRYVTQTQNRSKVLPAAYSTYVSNPLAPYLPMTDKVNWVPSVVAAATNSVTGSAPYQKAIGEEAAKDWEEMHNSNSKVSQLAQKAAQVKQASAERLIPIATGLGLGAGAGLLYNELDGNRQSRKVNRVNRALNGMLWGGLIGTRIGMRMPSKPSSYQPPQNTGPTPAQQNQERLRKQLQEIHEERDRRLKEYEARRAAIDPAKPWGFK